MGLTNFAQMDVWKKAHQITIDVYALTNLFPAQERFGLISQMQRAAVSVPSNIAEGFVAPSGRERARYYAIARCSAEALRYQLMLSRDLGYMKESAGLNSALDDVGAMLYRLRQYNLKS